MSYATTCPACGKWAVSECVVDPLSRPPREVELCHECAELERGRIAFESMRLAGAVEDGALPSDDELRAMARSMDSLWSDCPPDAFTLLEKEDGHSEDIVALAAHFRELGRRVGGEPAPAVKEFLDRHPPT